MEGLHEEGLHEEGLQDEDLNEQGLYTNYQLANQWRKIRKSQIGKV